VARTLGKRGLSTEALPHVFVGLSWEKEIVGTAEMIGVKAGGSACYLRGPRAGRLGRDVMALLCSGAITLKKKRTRGLVRKASLTCIEARLRARSAGSRCEEAGRPCRSTSMAQSGKEGEDTGENSSHCWGRRVKSTIARLVAGP